MNANLKFLILIILLTSVKSFSQVKSIDSERLAKMLEGSYSNEEQSKTDEQYNDVRFHFKKIWTERDDGKWLYGEQMSGTKADELIAQRVYRITNTYEGRFQIDEFILKDSSKFEGDWNNANPLSGMTPDSLRLADGCAIIVTLMNDGGYEGGTRGKECKSNLYGEAYIDSDVKISEESIITWKRGFDENDKQVWGPVSGGYIFKRMK